jgi:hypothetical protein
VARTGKRPWDCPIVKLTDDTGPILSAAADDTSENPEGDGYGIERVIGSVEGDWSNCDVSISVDDSWVSPGASVMLRLYSFSPIGRKLLAQVLCESAGLRVENGVAFGIVLGSRGSPADGFLVTARTPFATTRPSGRIEFRVWGTESLPNGVGNSPANGVFDTRMPSVASHLLAVNADATAPDPQWQPLHVDDTGALVVTSSGGGGGVVTGNVTPGDAMPNPTDAIGSASFTLAYDRAANTWGRVDKIDLAGAPPDIPDASAPATLAASTFLYGYSPDDLEWKPLKTDPLGFLYVGIAGSIPTQDGGVTYAGNYYAGQVQSLGQHRVRATADWYLTRGGYVTEVPPGESDGIVNSLATGAYNTTTPTLVDGQACTLQLDSSGRLLVSATAGGTTTPSDSLANPTDASNAATFTLAYNRAANTWGRVDRWNFTSGSTGIAIASSGAGLKTAAHLVGLNVSGSEWKPITTNGSGWLYVYPQGAYTVGDGRALLGQGEGVANTVAYLSHRDQANNSFNATRGGYATTIAAASLQYVLNVLGAATYQSGGVAPASGEGVVLQADAGGNLLTQIGKPAASSRSTPTIYESQGLTRDIIKASAGNILSVDISSEEATAVLWLMLFNSSSAPGGGAAPVWRRWLGSLNETPGNVQTIGRDVFAQSGIHFSTGIAWAVSTTRGTLTLPVSASIAINVTYV